jgi:hypothetical protein
MHWNSQKSPDELREKAKNYRRLALTITERQAVKALRDLADEYEALAIKLGASASLCPPS